MNWLTSLFSNQVFQTVIAGVFVFISGQIILKFFLEPILDLRRTIGKVDYELKFQAYIYTSSKASTSQLMETAIILRKLSSELETNFHAIPLSLLFTATIPSKQQIADAASDLIGLSNKTGANIHREDAKEVATRIRKNLKIDYLYQYSQKKK